MVPLRGAAGSSTHSGAGPLAWLTVGARMWDALLTPPQRAKDLAGDGDVMGDDGTKAGTNAARAAGTAMGVGWGGPGRRGPGRRRGRDS